MNYMLVIVFLMQNSAFHENDSHELLISPIRILQIESALLKMDFNLIGIVNYSANRTDGI